MSAQIVLGHVCRTVVANFRVQNVQDALGRMSRTIAARLLLHTPRVNQPSAEDVVVAKAVLEARTKAAVGKVALAV